MSTTDELGGVFDAIDNEVTAHDPIEEVSTEAVAEGAESTPETQETAQPESEETTSEAEAQIAETTNEADPETQTLSQTEESTEVEVEDWQQKLPPAPQPYQGPIPEFDPETGQITNMDPTQYEQYMRETAKAEFRMEQYQTTVDNLAMDAAEKVLPEIKTNPAIRTMVENARIASVINGEQISAVDAAKQVRDALGISPEKLSAARNEGAQNAKASITTQKAAALETGSTQVQEEDPQVELTRRINRGDDDAFAELLGMWEETGKI